MRQRPKQRLLAALALAGAMTLTTGCLYRMDIKQGNLLDPTQVLQLQNGLTKSQVRFLLGTPMLPNGFDSDRWNYYYYEKTRFTKKALTRRVTVWFKEDKVDHFERPEDTETVAAAMAAADAEAAAEVKERVVAPPPNMGAQPAVPTTPRQRH